MNPKVIGDELYDELKEMVPEIVPEEALDLIISHKRFTSVRFRSKMAKPVHKGGKSCQAARGITEVILRAEVVPPKARGRVSNFRRYGVTLGRGLSICSVVDKWNSEEGLKQAILDMKENALQHEPAPDHVQSVVEGFKHQTYLEDATHTE